MQLLLLIGTLLCGEIGGLKGYVCKKRSHSCVKRYGKKEMDDKQQYVVFKKCFKKIAFK